MPEPVSLTQHRITVLLVDDQASIGYTVQHMLGTEADIDFYYCQDPTQAVRMANQIQPTVILQDLIMPEIDGLTLVRYFRANPQTREVPLIVLSYKEEADVKAEAFALGVNDYMVKLPDRLEVVARIRYHSRAHINLLQKNEAMRELQKAKQAAELASQSKSIFLANMSHEIRTPMNAILGFAEILGGLVTDPVQREYLSAIHASGKSLLTLINDILDLSKVEAGKLSLEYSPVDPYPLFKDMGMIFSQKIQAKGLEFLLNIPPNLPKALLLDESRVRQILFNLIGNALKFTERGYIKLAVRHRWLNPEQTRLSLIFAVTDTGIGIPADQQQTIFEAFEQQRGQSHAKYGGTGLGLAICKRLTEMMGGELSLASEPGKGSTFSVALREVEVPAVTETVKPHARDIDLDAVRFAPATLLIADDIAMNRKLLRAYLEPYGFTFVEAKNGEEALELTERAHPDVILLDMKMPGMRGEQVADALKSQPRTQSIPLVAVTASAMRDATEDVQRRCDAYLLKPVSKAELVQALLPFLHHSLAETPPAAEAAAPVATGGPVPPPLIEYLRDSLLPVWQNLNPNTSVNEIEHFAESALQASRKYAYAPLGLWAEQLHTQARTFDMQAMFETLRGFDAFTR